MATPRGSQIHGLLHLPCCVAVPIASTNFAMSTSIRLVLRKSKTRADGTAPIYLRAAANRKSRFTSTGLYVKTKH